MSPRRAALVLACTAISGGVLGACGGGNDFVDSVPKSTPDLTVPSNGAGLPAAQTTSTTSTTSTTTTPTTSTGTSTLAPSTGATSTPASGTGGTPSGGTTTTPQTSTSNSGGTPAGGFSDFCKQNPGACGQ